MPIHGLPSLPPSRPAHFDIEKVIRPNILALHPYRCARDDYKEGVLLDANENALGHSLELSDANFDAELRSTVDMDLHRYPDPSHDPIKQRIATLRSIPGTDHVFLGVGSDEVIDMLMRVCVAPGKEKIMVTPPSYGMYAVSAQVNDIGVVKCPLELTGAFGEGGTHGRFSIKVDEVLHFFLHHDKCIDYGSDQKGCRRRSHHQVDLFVLTGESYWHLHPTLFDKGTTGLRGIQRDCDCR